MPLNIYNWKPYHINYVALQNHLLHPNVTFFDSPSNQQNYINQWIVQLQHFDKIDINHCNTKYKANTFLNLSNEPEVFQHESIVGTEKVLLHFRISYTKKCLGHVKHEDALTVDISSFATPKSAFRWSKPEKFSPTYSLNPTPIIAVGLPHENGRFLVIDGNHRIAKYMQVKAATVPVITIDWQQVYLNGLLATDFDKAYYLFHNDFYNLSAMKKYYNVSDIELIKNSWIDRIQGDSLQLPI